jgi:hypothetical protein
MRALRFLLLRRNLVDITFFGGFLLSAMFYSLHNKPYFYLVVTTVALFLTLADQPQEHTGRQRSPDGALALTPSG